MIAPHAGDEQRRSGGSGCGFGRVAPGSLLHGWFSCWRRGRERDPVTLRRSVGGAACAAQARRAQGGRNWPSGQASSTAATRGRAAGLSGPRPFAAEAGARTAGTQAGQHSPSACWQPAPSGQPAIASSPMAAAAPRADQSRRRRRRADAPRRRRPARRAPRRRRRACEASARSGARAAGPSFGRVASSFSNIWTAARLADPDLDQIRQCRRSAAPAWRPRPWRAGSR
jgi:hypothetical protein